jgi:hypothetical protein
VSAANGSGQATTVNTNFGSALQARVSDASANPVNGVTVTFTAPSSGASGRFSGAATATASTNASGIAVAPTLTANGTVGSYTVVATVSGVSASASFSLTNNTQPPPTPNGSWAVVTPPGINLSTSAPTPGQNFGVIGMVADSSRPGRVYASTYYQGLWRSDDYGLTWSEVPVTGQNPTRFGAGNGLTMAPDGSYMITSALFPSNGSNGAWKSTDGGQTWTKYTVGAPNGDDISKFAISPRDKTRVVASPHSPASDNAFHLYESRDSGQTWRDQGSMGGAGSAAVSWIDDDTLLAVSDGDNGNGAGTWRGVRSGTTWPWSWTWTRVSNQQRWHGSHMPYIDPATGAIFSGGGFGIQKSVDGGRTWTTVSNVYSAAIVGTATTMYSTANYASGAGFAPHLATASRAAGGTTWTEQNAPAGFSNGWHSAVAICNGTNYVIIGSNWLAGIWRYVENSPCTQ